MAKIDEKDKETIRGMFNDRMEGTANVLFFGSKTDCDYCEDTKEILEELAELTDKMDLKIYDKEENADEVSRLGVDKFPAIVFVKEDGTDTGMRFYGIPSGYEFGSLIEGIMDVGNNSTQLTETTLEQLKNINQEVVIQVFVTPTCPHCPRAVRIAHQMALMNPNIRGEMIEAMEFPELSSQFNVMGVPKTVINGGKEEQEGAVPEEVILEKIMSVVQ